jgi:hypothetical protein
VTQYKQELSPSNLFETSRSLASHGSSVCLIVDVTDNCINASRWRLATRGEFFSPPGSLIDE